ncbi:LOW QUALITY PROTEIN: uncharacterized protein T551_01334 [Pneumocystis jirovecii RU7]|uniref:Uncharacterized protein n=1 Tax=Pneumocystis jirovecii (strain RU7) TaxID=1408657 RepID=A0A0W4ZSD0_PNEJ7|nr:LOW QUALITY PROTEIN: uncharacterized protein T551_01334 [Pneumocystis jirovecii RU7]KTW31262.1 LOW QUALITY PROTEIN: hypothetical protein T551_01334 [Pneumocystis jirovecii RU7]
MFLSALFLVMILYDLTDIHVLAWRVFGCIPFIYLILYFNTDMPVYVLWMYLPTLSYIRISSLERNCIKLFEYTT